MSPPDVESLQPAPRQRGRCPDPVLLGAVITLFVLLLLGAAFGFWVITDLRAQMDERCPRVTQGLVSALTGNPGGMLKLSSSYKGQNFAYLTPESSDVINGNMMWTDVKYGHSSTIGSGYRYHSGHGTLKVLQDGPYFLYTQLNLTCAGACSNGSFSITFSDYSERLSCSLQLLMPHHSPIVKTCWTVIPRLTNGTRLVAKTRTNVPSKGWKLDLNHSGFGMFLVD